MAYKLLFLDTETTGNETKDYLCQVAWSDGKNRHSALFKPPVPISYESMAVHHITNKMVADKPAFKFSTEHAEVAKRFADEETVFIAHNAIFDLGMLAKEGLVPQKYICTLRVARHLDPEEKISSYRLQYLRYFLDLEVDNSATAHDALGDVLVLEQLFDRLFKKIIETDQCTELEAYQKMIDISSHPSLIKTFKFGKHVDKKVEEVAKIDPGYLEWLLNQKLESNPDDEDWIYTLKHYLGK
ncbi:3'-5' exonuclease [Candidatus Nomurabacteria bacterium]|nr:MAG: 3'-5' exonuclease [Candidatus Nomurabacteria bacterium]